MKHNHNLALTRIELMWAYIGRRRFIILKFLVISGSAVVLNLGLLYFMVRHLGFGSPLGQNIANALSMEIGITYNFFLSRAITWKDRHREKGKQLFAQIVKFHATLGITILFRLGLFALLQLFGVYYIVNAGIGIAISAVFNFLVYDTFIFKTEGPETV